MKGNNKADDPGRYEAMFEGMVSRYMAEFYEHEARFYDSRFVQEACSEYVAWRLSGGSRAGPRTDVILDW